MDLVRLIFFHVCVVVSTAKYTTEKWNMDKHCFSSLAKGLLAGELLFDANDLSSSTEHDCRVAIEPAITQDGNSRISLYFTEFNVGQYCADTNITILNGKWDEETVSPAILNRYLVEGLPPYICGQNSTLVRKYQVYYTSGRSFTVIYRSRSSRGISGKFKLKFASYHEGPCSKAEDEHMYACSNGKCISEDLTCLNDIINACGYEDTSLNEMCKISDDVVDWLSKGGKFIGYIFAVGFGVLVLHWIYRKTIKPRYGTLRNLPIIKEFCNSNNNSNEPETETTTPVPSTEIRLNADTLPPDPPTVLASAPPQDMFQFTSEAAPPYCTLDFTPPEKSSDCSFDTQPHQELSSSLPPPPSYQEVLENQDKYVK